MPSKDNARRKPLAAVLRENRTPLTRALFDAVRDESCATWKIPQQFEDLQEWGRSQLLTAMDLLIAWLETRDRVFLELFAGWIHSRVAAGLSKEGAPHDFKPNKAIELSTLSWMALLKPQVPAEDIAMLETDLEQAQSFLSGPPLKRIRALFIGDCLQSEVITALIAPCTQAQIRIEPTLINERVQSVLRNRIRKCRPDEFDIVFFSPFSRTFLPQYQMILKPKSRLWRRARVAAALEAMLKDTLAISDALADHFDCPIYVHNTSGTVSSFGIASGLAKNLVSRRNRVQARRIINHGITRHLADSSSEARLQILDEDALRGPIPERELGRVYLNSHAFHPTRLGVELGRGPYFEAIYARAFLNGKKVVVCDLDNTLWDGVIGEGPVTHYLERQQLLKGLRERGVLLTINSKNDARNVHWSGAALQADDFVAERINWNSKVENLAAIRDELDLGLKDFVFIDDRPDELERVRSAFPEMVVLNATDPRTWKFLECWQRTLPVDSGEDRTRLYRERREREQFVNGLANSTTPVEDEKAALLSLQLSVKIREANRSGLKRAAELINRTNQFNLCGSRTTARELEDGLGKSHLVITAEASDKFGNMGVVGVMRVDYRQDRVEIPIFVLSCRAFGFGIECALLNTVRKLARRDQMIVGHYKKTQFNQPCRRLYPESGMHWEGKIGDLPPDPEWLNVDNRIETRVPETRYATTAPQDEFSALDITERGRIASR